jgi:hypothetical protein
MKTLIHQPLPVYLAAGIISLAIMTLIDYILGAEATHLNAWDIICKLFGIDTGLPDSLAVRKLGLAGATVIMLMVNMAAGAGLVWIVRGINYLLNM